MIRMVKEVRDKTARRGSDNEGMIRMVKETKRPEEEGKTEIGVVETMRDQRREGHQKGQ